MKYFKYSFLAIIFTMLGCSNETPNQISDAQTRSQILNHPKIKWEKCPSKNTNQDLQCGNILVPRDYENDDFQYYVIGLIKIKAKDQANKIGTIFLNPGGPGGEGTMLAMMGVYEEPYKTPKQLRDRFDFVGFDPRGVGSSTNTISNKLDNRDVFVNNKCYIANIHDRASAIDQLDANDLKKVLLAQKEFYENCIEETNNDMLYTGTHNVVKDINQLRKALGEDKINYIGYSYGGRIGALLAQEYPKLARAILLDAPMHPSKELAQIAIDNIQSTYDVFKTGYQKCETLSKDCPSIEQIAKKFQLVEQKLLKSRDTDQDMFELQEYHKVFHYYIYVFVNEFNYYGVDAQETIFDTFLEHYKKDINSMSKSSITRSVRKFPDYADINGEMLFQSVMCNDSIDRYTILDVENAYKNLDNSNANILFRAGQMFSTYGICSNFPIAKQPVKIHSTTNPKVIIVSGIHDPATPRQWAQSLHENLNSLHIKSNHIGHTVTFGSQQAQGYNICSDKIITKYFLDLSLPTVDEIECDMTSREEIRDTYNIDIDNNESLISKVQDNLISE